MLEYFALFLVFFVIIFLFYGIIVIHDIPYEIAVHRNHPQKEAIHVAGWISLFTLGAIWPFLWIWASLNKTQFHVKNVDSSDDIDNLSKQLASLKEEVSNLKQQINKEG